MQRHHLAALVSTGILGCGGVESHDLGNTAEHLPLSEGSEERGGFGASMGSWIGEGEDPLAMGSDGTPVMYRFPSGDTRLRLELVAPDSAWIVFGNDAPPAPPSDYDVGYPLGVDYAAPGLVGSALRPPVEGFRYQLSTVSEEVLSPDGALRLYYAQNQVFADWCAGQDPEPLFDGSYGCLGPNSSGYVPAAGASSSATCSYVRYEAVVETPVDCNKLILCAPDVSVCTCNEDGCGSDEGLRSGLFLRVAGDELVGSFVQSAFMAESGYLTTLGTVRFRRAE